MKVYVVEHYLYYSMRPEFFVEKVFDDKSKAEKYIQEQDRKYSEYDIVELELE